MKSQTNNSVSGQLFQVTQKVLLATTLLTAGIGAHANIAAYDNTVNFTGFSINSNGATSGNKITNMIADDITFDPSFEGATLSSFSFSVGNGNTTAVSARAKVRFYMNDGANGGPGTLLPVIGFNFSLISFPAGSVGTYTASLAPGQFSLPTTTNTIWAGLSFDAVGSTATAAQLNKLGPGTFDPPVIGSSQDLDFVTSGTPGQFTSSNPAGSVVTSPFGAAPVANFGWKFTTTTADTPSPSSLAVLALGGLPLVSMLRRRRTARK